MSIDANPGGPGNEAGMVNKAFRAVVLRMLKPTLPTGEDVKEVQTWMFHRAALRRLGEVGIAEEHAKSQLNSVPGMGHPWLAYLSLAPLSVIEDIIHDAHEGG